MISMAHSADHFAVFKDIFRKRHAHISRIAQLVKTCPCPLSHQGTLPDRSRIRAFPGCDARRVRQFHKAVRDGHMSA